MSSPVPSSSSSSSSSYSDTVSSPKIQIREIPGDYGRRFFGPIKDRLDFYYNQGRDEFFKSRMVKYKSTIFRANMPPGPFISTNSKVIVLLDAISFPVLFDLSKVDKTDVLDGTYMPSTAFTGGYRACAYLDSSDPNHSKLKRLFFNLLSSLHQRFIPEFQRSLSELFANLEDHLEISNNKGSSASANFNNLSDDMSFNFVFRLLFNKNPVDTSLGSKGLKIVTKWLLFQLAPLMTLGLPKSLSFLEDLLLHTFKFPWFPVKSDYEKLYDAVYSSSTSILDEAERSLGLKRDEACHNLIFLAFFNAFGGMKAWFPILIKWLSLAGPELHVQLASEIRAVVKAEGVTLSALDKMKLTKSTVYEALRIEPPIPYQYARAKRDIVIHSHDASFQVKKGEMLFGYQTFATKDERVFERPEVFVANRFVGEEGEKLLRYVYWSNGRESESSTEENKQCPAKDLVLLLSRMMVTQIFLRYDTFTAEIGSLSVGSLVTVKSLTKATNSEK